MYVQSLKADYSDGPQGPQGDVGATGPQGVVGDVGSTGPTGPQGVDGAAGSTGPQGVVGAVGATGPTGPQGVDGVAGAVGATGPQGVDGVVGAVGATGPGGPTEISFLGLNPTTVQDPLSSAQTDYQGLTELYTSGGVIANGQAVVLEYGASAVRAISPTSMPSADQVVGIAMNATTAAGQQVRVLKNGFGSAALPVPVVVLLNNSANGQTFTDTRVLFRDSGGLGFGAGAEYQNNQNLQCVFDAGVGDSWSIQFVTDPGDSGTFFEFNQSTAFMLDRLGIQESTDGVSWTNINVTWMQKSAVIAAPWGAQFGGGSSASYNSASAINGWILPGTVARAIELGYVTGTPITVNNRYLRFWFVSDQSSTFKGWNIELSRVISTDAPVYIDVDDLSKVTLIQGGALVGRTASSDTSLGSILVRRDTVGPPPKSYGGMTTNGNSTKTDVPSQGVYYNIVGTKAGNNLQDFTQSGDELTYTGVKTKSFVTSASASVWLEEGKEPETLGFAVFVNSTIQNNTRVRRVLFAGDEWAQSTAFSGIVTMVSGQTVSSRVANLTSNSDVEVVDYTFTIVEI